MALARGRRNDRRRNPPLVLNGLRQLNQLKNGKLLERPNNLVHWHDAKLSSADSA